MYEKTGGNSRKDIYYLLGIAAIIIVLAAVVLLVPNIFSQHSEVSDKSVFGTNTKEDIMPLIVSAVGDDLNDISKEIIKASFRLDPGKSVNYVPQAVIDELYESVPIARMTFYLDTNNVILNAAPEYVKQYLGKSMTGNVDRNKQTFEKGSYVILSKYASVDGKNFCCVLISPVYNGDNLSGMITMPFEQSAMLEKIDNEYAAPAGLKMFVCQTDGVQIYNTEKGQIGQNIITSYDGYMGSDMKAVMNDILTSRDGKAAYIYHSEDSGKSIYKEAYWDTVDFSGQQWRVVLTSEKVI